MASATLAHLPDKAYDLGNLVEDFRISWFELLFNVIVGTFLLGLIAVLAVVRFGAMFPLDPMQLVVGSILVVLLLGRAVWSW